MSFGQATVLICDDHALLAEGIAGLLRQKFAIVGLCADGRDLLERAGQLRPDFVTLDIGMPGMNGLEAARRLALMLPRTRIVCVTQQVDLQYLSAALHEGVRGFVAKQSAYSELLDAMRVVQLGKIYITPLLREVYTDSLKSGPGILMNRESVLTDRQREILQLIAEGKATKEIAFALGISGKTVEFHRGGISRALGLRTVADLTRYAISHRIAHI